MNIRCERDHKRSLRRVARGVRWQESAVSEKLRKELISKRRMWSTVSCKRNCKKAFINSDIAKISLDGGGRSHTGWTDRVKAMEGRSPVQITLSKSQVSKRLGERSEGRNLCMITNEKSSLGKGKSEKRHH